MNDLERYQSLKKRAEELRRRNDRAVGARRQLLEQLQAKGVGSEEEARKRVKKLKRDLPEKEAAFAEKLKEVEESWPESN